MHDPAAGLRIRWKCSPPISGTKRHPLFPDLPTFAESGLADFAPMAWFGIFAPGGTPPSITDGLAAAIGDAAKALSVCPRTY